MKKNYEYRSPQQKRIPPKIAISATIRAFCKIYYADRHILCQKQNTKHIKYYIKTEWMRINKIEKYSLDRLF